MNEFLHRPFTAAPLCAQYVKVIPLSVMRRSLPRASARALGGCQSMSWRWAVCCGLAGYKILHIMCPLTHVSLDLFSNVSFRYRSEVTKHHITSFLPLNLCVLLVTCIHANACVCVYERERGRGVCLTLNFINKRHFWQAIKGRTVVHCCNSYKLEM